MINLEGSDLSELDDEGKKAAGMVFMHQRWYWQVAPRLNAFKKSNPTIAVHTEIITLENTHCVMQCRLVDENGLVHGIGHSLESRTDRGVNATSYLENAETSAVGRALASVGWSGGEYASAEELLIAINNEGYNEALWLMAMGEPSKFCEHISSLNEDDQSATFGGAPNGRITHFKSRWRELQNVFGEWASNTALQLKDYADTGSVSGLKEIISELNEFELERVKGLITEETNLKITQLVKGH